MIDKKLRARAPGDFVRMIFGTSLSRILSHFKMNDFAIISAFKIGTSKKENLENQYELGRRLVDMGYGYIPQVGYWEGVQERSLFVPNLPKETAKELASEFGQDAYLWGSKGDWKVYDASSDEIVAGGTKFKVVEPDEEFSNYSEVVKKKYQLVAHLTALEKRGGKSDQFVRTVEGLKSTIAKYDKALKKYE